MNYIPTGEKIRFTLPHCPLCDYSHTYEIQPWREVVRRNERPPKVYNKTFRCPVRGRTFQVGIEEAQ